MATDAQIHNGVRVTIRKRNPGSQRAVLFGPGTEHSCCCRGSKEGWRLGNDRMENANKTSYAWPRMASQTRQDKPSCSPERVRLRKCVAGARNLVFAALIQCVCAVPASIQASDPASVDTTATFPAVSEVLEGHVFRNDTERDVFFLRAIHEQYAAHWQDLLEANITPTDYVQSPAKLLRFVAELGQAMRNRNDAGACANLARIVGEPAFYANTNAYHPEILRAAARALIDIGAVGQKTLASAFSESHYRMDPVSLEDLAQVIGENRPAEPELAHALTATAFDYSTTNGAIYPRCTTISVTNLLRLGEGPSAVQARLKSNHLFENLGRAQAIVDGLAAAHATDLATNLALVEAQVRTKLARLTNSPGAYRDDLQELSVRIERTLASFGKAALPVELN